MAERVNVEKKVLSANDQIAAETREQLEGSGVFCLNLISSPGSGKTMLLERTIDALRLDCRLAVIAGDVQTRNDADRLVRHAIPVEAIETGGGCHLNAQQVADRLGALNLSDLDVLFIENVGNLVCPSSFDLGETQKAVLMSVTEGEDKPLKYPAAFRRAGVFVLTKIDLVPHLEFDVRQAIENARSVNPELEIFSTSSLSGEGLKDWSAWLRARATERQRSHRGERA